ncbi:Fructosamine kinase-domain-containing protein [Tirmania nivea]|nr:Fructosamine kinase-domain-containing protein [Tirmania nivea]
MTSTSTLETNPVLISSLARILEIEEGEFEKRCKVSVTSISGGSQFSNVYKVGVFENNEEWLWFLKVVEGEEMVRGEFYSLKAIHLSVPHLCPLPYCYGPLYPSAPTTIPSQTTFYDDSPTMPSLPLPSPSPEPLDLNPTTITTPFFLLTDYISPLPSSPSTTLHPHQRLSYKLALLHSIPAPSEGVPGFPVTTMCGSTPQPNHPLPGGEGGKGRECWREFFAGRRLKAVARRCPKLKTKSKREEGKDVPKLVERVEREVVPRLMKDDEGLVVCHGDLWSGNFMKGRIERAWGGTGGSRRGRDSREVVDREGQDDGEDENGNDGKKRSNVHRETITGEFVFDPAAVYAPPLYDHGIMHMFGGFGGSFWSAYWHFRKEFHLPVPTSNSPSNSPPSPFKPLPWDIQEQPTSSDARVKIYELYHYLNHYALFGWTYGLEAEKLMRGLLGVEGARPGSGRFEVLG